MESFKDFLGIPDDQDESDDEELDVNMACFICGSENVKVRLDSGNIVGVCPDGHESVLPWSFGV